MGWRSMVCRPTANRNRRAGCHWGSDPIRFHRRRSLRHAGTAQPGRNRLERWRTTTRSAGTPVGAGNTIAFNIGQGVVVTDNGTVGNRVLGNLIYDNGAGTPTPVNKLQFDGSNYVSLPGDLVRNTAQYTPHDRGLVRDQQQRCNLRLPKTGHPTMRRTRGLPRFTSEPTGNSTEFFPASGGSPRRAASIMASGITSPLLSTV